MVKKKFENIFKIYSKRIFIIDSRGIKISYKQFYESVLKTILILKKKGCKKNTKIIILDENSVNYLIILVACIFGGFVACPLDPTIKKERIKKIKKLYKSKLILKDLKELKLNKTSLNLDSRELNYDDTDCLLINSYGKNGEPTGILFKSSSILGSADSFSKLAKYNNKTVILHCLPMFYMGGILDTFFSPLISGSKIIVAEKFTVLNAKNFWTLPIQHKCNTLFLTPSIIALMTTIFRNSNKTTLNHVSTYKSIFATGSILYPEVRKKFFKIFKKRISSCYGSTEIGGPLCIQKNRASFKKNFCVGGHSKEVKIKEKAGYGRDFNYIFVKTPYFMKGYLTSKGLIRPIDKKGYFNTGDLGYYYKKTLFIKDTNRAIIKKGGELISLNLIEKTALQLKSIKNVFAIGKTDFYAGQEIFLFVSLKKGINKERALKKINLILKNNLRPVEVPKKILFLDKINLVSERKKNKDQLIKLI